MTDFIVSNQAIDKTGKLLTWNEFLEAASSEKGIDVTGDLYIDVKGLDYDVYEAIKDTMPEAQYFSTNGASPSFVKDRVLDWSTKTTTTGRAATAVKPALTKAQGATETAATLGIASDPNIRYADQDIAEFGELDEESYQDKQARVILFGSSKGGTGKTFTCLISAYRYAKTHPNQRVAVSDFDIIDGQVGISVHKVTPTMFDYYKAYKLGDDSFATMERFKTKSENFPPNLDFYLAPKDIYIRDNDFWDSIFINLIQNYDVVFFDSGIDYMNYKPISTLYKIADKVILVSTTSIKSVSSVSKQITRLQGEIKNAVFTPEDRIGEKLNLVITQAGKTDEMNSKVCETFVSKGVNIVGLFGVLTHQIQKAEYYGNWSVFDKNTKFNQTLDRIVE